MRSRQSRRKSVGPLEAIELLPVLPLKAEDILTNSSRERHKWIRDGRPYYRDEHRQVSQALQGRYVPFFDPRHIEDVLDRDLPAVWRQEDAQAVTESGRRPARKAALSRAGKGEGKPSLGVSGKMTLHVRHRRAGRRSTRKECCAERGRPRSACPVAGWQSDPPRMNCRFASASISTLPPPEISGAHSSALAPPLPRRRTSNAIATAIVRNRTFLLPGGKILA
jgi:hypothetical protein